MTLQHGFYEHTFWGISLHFGGGMDETHLIENGCTIFALSVLLAFCFHLQMKALEPEDHHFLHILFNPSGSDFFILT